MIKGNPGIYMIVCISNGRRYIGSSHNCEKRYVQHLSDLNKNKHGNPHLQKSWNKYEKNDFMFIIIERCQISELIYKEQSYIDELTPEFNIRKLANSNLGIKWNEEQRANQSRIHMGHPSSKKGKKTGIPAWNRGIPQTEEVKRKLSEINKGSRNSIRTEFKKGHLNEKRLRPVKCIETGTIFKSLKEAGIFVGKATRSMNIRACCIGRQQTAFGYHWEFA